MKSLPDYRDDAHAYEIEERSRPDEMRMLKRSGEVASNWLYRCNAAHVLDLCCGTGLSMEALIAHPNVSSVTGVDVSTEYLDFARRRYSNGRVIPTLLQDDAVTGSLPRARWDLVMLASAYHHIEDARKVDFLKRVRGLIGNMGRAVMAENVLPEYAPNDPNAYVEAVRRFYDLVLITARRDNPQLPDYIAGLIERVAQYGFDGDYEYKVSFSILQRHLMEANLEIESIERVWPDDSLLEPGGGNYILLLRAANNLCHEDNGYEP